MLRKHRYIVCASLSVFSICLALVTPTWAQDTSSAPKSVPWWEIMTGILAIPTAIIGISTAYWLSKKTRLETRKLQLEILREEGKLPQEEPGVIRRQHVIDSPRALATGVQDFMIRFIILYVAVYSWDIIERLLTPLLSASIAYWLSGHPGDGQRWSTILLLSAYSQITAIGDLVIFFLFGWPLLLDVARFVGLRPFKFLRSS